MRTIPQISIIDLPRFKSVGSGFRNGLGSQRLIIVPLCVDTNCITDGTFLCVAALSDPPIFAEPIPNVTVALGRDVSLPCVIENLGSYKVTQLNSYDA